MSSDELINILTKGIGRDLWLPIRRNYWQTKSSLIQNDSFNRLSNIQKQFCIDLLALSIFHSHVIVPLHGSMNFFLGTKPLGVKSITLGNYSFGEKERARTDAATKQFFAILKAFGIEIFELSFGSVREFLERISDRAAKHAIED